MPRRARRLLPEFLSHASRGNRILLAAATSVVFSSCAFASKPQPFSTDGCSMFPDRSLIGKSDWCACCLAHDLAYWRGGTVDERLKADEELKSCVFAASGKRELAELMFSGVRLGGGPYYFTPYRWGYGWPYGRGYATLTSTEEAEISGLREQYVASNPTLACPTEPQLSAP